MGNQILERQPIQLEEKQQLEITKLSEEIKEFKKKWYKKPQYISAIFPTTIALLSLIGLILNGNFETKTQQLQLRREKLEFDISKFEFANANAQKINDSLQRQMKRLNDSIFKLSSNNLTNEKSLDSMRTLTNELFTKLRTNQSDASNKINLTKLAAITTRYETLIDEFKVNQYKLQKQNIDLKDLLTREIERGEILQKRFDYLWTQRQTDTLH